MSCKGIVGHLTFPNEWTTHSTGPLEQNIISRSPVDLSKAPRFCGDLYAFMALISSFIICSVWWTVTLLLWSIIRAKASCSKAPWIKCK